MALFPDTKELITEKKVAEDTIAQKKKEDAVRKERQTNELSKKKELLTLLREKGIKRGDFLFQNLREFMKVTIPLVHLMI